MTSYDRIVCFSDLVFDRIACVSDFISNRIMCFSDFISERIDFTFERIMCVLVASYLTGLCVF